MTGVDQAQAEVKAMRQAGNILKTIRELNGNARRRVMFWLKSNLEDLEGESAFSAPVKEEAVVTNGSGAAAADAEAAF